MAPMKYNERPCLPTKKKPVHGHWLKAGISNVYEYSPLRIISFFL